MADVPVPKEERDRVFRKLLAKADNRTCFDCPQRKPIWASSTFGVFICLDCAGGQRRLGTHLTFVRSVDMDTWTRGQLEAMKRGGNGRARDFFRAHGARDLHIRQDTKYASSTARQYRDRLAKEVQQALQGGAAPSPLATPELPKKSFFEDFEPMEMPPRTQSSPALATPAASVKMPVPRAEPDAAQFRVRSAAQMKQARAASGKLSAAGLSAAGLSAAGRGRRRRAGAGDAGAAAARRRRAPPRRRRRRRPRSPPPRRPRRRRSRSWARSRPGPGPAPAPAPAPVLRAPTRRAPALGACASARRAAASARASSRAPSTFPRRRRGRRRPGSRAGRPRPRPSPGRRSTPRAALDSGGSLWQQAPPPKRAPPPPPPPAADDDDDDDDDDWYSDAPKKGGQAEAAQRAKEAAAEGFDDADGFFDARSGSSRLAAAYAEASAARRRRRRPRPRRRGPGPRGRGRAPPAARGGPRPLGPRTGVTPFRRAGRGGGGAVGASARDRPPRRHRPGAASATARPRRGPASRARSRPRSRR